MARTVEDKKIDTKAARLKLAVGDVTHWRCLVPNELHIGWRRRTPGSAGVWTLRRYVGKRECASGYVKRVIGIADDVEQADGKGVLSFADAVKLAHARGDEAKAPERTAMPTVAEAMADQIRYYQNAKTADDAKRTAAAHILPALGKVRIDRLTLKQLERWRSDLLQLRKRVRTPVGQKQAYGTALLKKGTVKKVEGYLTAALTRARRHHPDLSDAAWRLLEPLKEASVPRTAYLSVPEALRLVRAAPDAAFADLLQAGLVTGCRYSEICRMRVADFSGGNRVMIPISKSGEWRVIRLAAEGAAFFASMCAGRAGDELIFTHANGSAWGIGHQTQRMRMACKKAGIKPMGFHQLRHTFASQAVMAGMPLLVLSKLLGHSSTKMVERHYAHLSEKHMDKMVDAHSPTYGLTPATNVVALDDARKEVA